MRNFRGKDKARHPTLASGDRAREAGSTRGDAETREVPAKIIPGPAGESTRSRLAIEAALFFFAIFLVYVISPVISSLDSHFVLPTALSMIRHGDANIDEYSAQFPEAPWAVVREKEHSWNVYPAGVPFLVLPMVWLVDKIEAVFGSNLEADAIRKSPLLLELILASIITAAAAALLFCYIRPRLSPVQSLLLASLFALGTSVYSSASRGLWQHGPSMLLLIGAVLLYERLDRWKGAAAVALGFVAGYSYAVRPANLIVPFGFALLLALTARPRLIPYLGGAVLGVAPLFAFHLTVFGTWSSYYYRMTQGSAFSLAFPPGPLAATLVSPSRGLFVFSPFLLFLAVRFWPSYRRRYKVTPIEMLLMALSLAWWISASRWFMWWGGGSYGPRLLCDLLPCLTILLIPVVANLSPRGGAAAKALCVLFAIAGVFSLGVHLRGATAAAASEWNGTPIGVDQAPQRVWSWRDPQFLRGLHHVALTNPEFEAPADAMPLAFYPITPCRLLDTRLAPGVFGGPALIAEHVRRIPVPAGPCKIPRRAAAYSLNLTAMPRGPLGWLNAWADGEPMPVTSVLNAPAGAVTANAAIVQAGREGAIALMGTYATDLVIDINGYFAPVLKSLP